LRTIASGPIWTLRPTGSYGFTVCVFAIEVRLAAFFVSKVATAFKGDSFFAFAARLNCTRGWPLSAAFLAFATRRFSTAGTFAITGRRGHLRALLAQNRFAAQLDSVPFNAQDFHQHLVTFLQLVFHFLHSMFRNLADVQQAIGSRNDFDERAKLRQPHHFTQIRLPDFRHCRQVVNPLNRFLR
jgi:hypothetical protein